MFAILKVGLAAATIAFVSWLAGKKPELAGFLTALPLVSILAIAFAYWQHQDIDQTAQYAKSILVAIPLSCLFFVPFFFIGKYDLNFWLYWCAGIAMIAIGYYMHQFIMKFI